MKKLLLAVAVAAAAMSGAASATSIHNDGINSVDLGGRVEARYNTEDHDVSRARLNVTLNHKINDKVSVMAFAEGEMNHDGFTAKDTYAGFVHNGSTVITYGHQDSADNIVTDITDVFNYNGAEANARFAGGDNTFKITNQSGTTASGFSFTQNKDFSSWTDTIGQSSDTKSYVGAITHGFGKVTVGGSYGYSEFTSNSMKDASMYQVGAAYDGDVVYLGALGSYMNLNTTKGSDVNSKGLELAGIYHMTPKINVLTGYNYRHVEAGHAGIDVTNYYLVGSEYKFDSNIKVYGEYKDDVTSVNDDQFTVAVKYTF